MGQLLRLQGKQLLAGTAAAARQLAASQRSRSANSKSTCTVDILEPPCISFDDQQKTKTKLIHGHSFKKVVPAFIEMRIQI
jgi:hypothetical protein